MITYEEALEILTKFAPALSEEEVLLQRSVGRISSRKIESPENYPRFPNSSMDGFAIVSSQTNGASEKNPLEFKICGMTAAGDDRITGRKCGDFECHEIMTGAPVPDCYDSIIALEDVEVITDASGKKIKIKLKDKVPQGQYLRKAGEDIEKGSSILSEGVSIEAEHILELATLGVQSVRVRRKPRVAIISTGSELGARKGESDTSGKIRNSTAPWLLSFLPQINTEVTLAVEVGDNLETFINAFRSSVAKAADIIISTGAVSMGTHDFVVSALEKLGVEIHFHRTAIRPGKPILFGTFKKTDGRFAYIFGLPGNPASTICGARFFVEHFVRTMFRQKPEVFIDAKMTCDFEKSEGLLCFYPAKIQLSIEGARVTPLPNPASFKVKPFTQGNGWVVLDKDVTVVKKGTVVKACFMQSDTRLERAMSSALVNVETSVDANGDCKC